MIDYSNLSMTFFHIGHLVEFQGTTDPASVILTLPQGASACFHIAITPSELPSNDYEEPSFPPQVQHLLTQFTTLFEEPHSLPPSRLTDHHIHLHPNSGPINVRPYRYPHYQKQEIESQVASMLQNKIIQPSTSPFSSPVLLVRKHDGSWHFYVDYRALNSIMIKDFFRYPQ